MFVFENGNDGEGGEYREFLETPDAKLVSILYAGTETMIEEVRENLWIAAAVEKLPEIEDYDNKHEIDIDQMLYRIEHEGRGAILQLMKKEIEKAEDRCQAKLMDFEGNDTGSDT